MDVFVVPHDPGWRTAYAAEEEILRRMLGTAAVEIHHIGSTAVPGLPAKPIIDILVEADVLAALDALKGDMEAIGCEALGEFGIPGRRYFRKNDAAGVRSHQVHVFEAGSDGARRHIAFRDYLIKHPDQARRYGALKQRLAAAHPDDIDAYMDGKDALVKQLEMAALDWQGRGYGLLSR